MIIILNLKKYNIYFFNQHKWRCAQLKSGDPFFHYLFRYYIIPFSFESVKGNWNANISTIESFCLIYFEWSNTLLDLCICVWWAYVFLIWDRNKMEVKNEIEREHFSSIFWIICYLSFVYLFNEQCFASSLFYFFYFHLNLMFIWRTIFNCDSVPHSFETIFLIHWNITVTRSIFFGRCAFKRLDK